MGLSTFSKHYLADTAVGQIVRKSDGVVVASYDLDRQRRWNIGFRRHVNELTGRIVLALPDGRRSTHDDWDGVALTILGAGWTRVEA